MKKFVRRLLMFIIATSILICFVGCGDNSNSNPDSSSAAPERKTYSLGDTVTIKNGDGSDKLKVTINAVTLTDDRSQYTNKNPAQVVVVDYTYENVGSDSDIYYSSSCIRVTDEKENVCDTYPIRLNECPKSTPKGSKCRAKQAYGTVEESQKIKLYLKDSILDTDSSDDAIVEVNLE